MKYELIPSPRSYCPKCTAGVVLLAPAAEAPGDREEGVFEMDQVVGAVRIADLTGEDLDIPAFYICWSCRFIGQVGVGPVPEATDA